MKDKFEIIEVKNQIDQYVRKEKQKYIKKGKHIHKVVFIFPYFYKIYYVSLLFEL